MFILYIQETIWKLLFLEDVARKCVVGKKWLATYCQTTVLHTECRAECCLKYFEGGYNMTKCQFELQCQEPKVYEKEVSIKFIYEDTSKQGALFKVHTLI